MAATRKTVANSKRARNPVPLPPLGTYPDAELVLGFVYPVGTDFSGVLATLKARIEQFGYTSKDVRLSGALRDLIARFGLTVEIDTADEARRVRSLMNAGNAARRKAKRNDIMALIAAQDLYASRQWPKRSATPAAYKRTVHIILSLKRPEEVDTLRKIYGTGVYLIGLFSTEQERLSYLVDEKDLDEAEARADGSRS